MAQTELVPNERDLDDITQWDKDAFLQRLVAIVEEHNAKERLITAMQKVGLRNNRKYFSDPEKNPELPERFTAVHFIKLAMLLPLVGVDVSLDDLVRRETRPRPKLASSIERLEQKVDRTLRLDDVVERILRGFAEDIRGRIGPAIAEQRDAILAHRTDRVDGHLIAPEIRAIGRCSQHIRVVTNHLNFGVQWSQRPDGAVVAERTANFNIVAERFRSCGFTFVMPRTVPDGCRPGPLEPNSAITWEDWFNKFREFFVTVGGIPREVWDENVSVVHTDLPIPVGYLVFGLSAEGRKRLRSMREGLHDWLDESKRFWLPAEDGGAFAGILIPDRGVANFAALLDRQALLHATTTFFEYLNSATQDLSPCEGIPVGHNHEFREASPASLDWLNQVKPLRRIAPGNPNQ